MSILNWLFTTECNHPSFTEIRDGVQYCIKCNKAFKPSKNIVWGPHKLKNIDNQNITVHNSESWSRLHQTLTVQQCERCGRMFTFNTTSGEYENEYPGIEECMIE